MEKQRYVISQTVPYNMSEYAVYVDAGTPGMGCDPMCWCGERERENARGKVGERGREGEREKGREGGRRPRLASPLARRDIGREGMEFETEW